MPLQNGQYIEVVCPLDHPATEQTPWGKAVSKKAQEGGGWLTWVFATEDISMVEEKFGRSAIDGHRTRPDGTDLKWKQIGVNETLDECAASILDRMAEKCSNLVEIDKPIQDSTLRFQ
jgi:hypothetical protein